MATRAEVEAILDEASAFFEKKGIPAAVGIAFPTWWDKVCHPSLLKKGSCLLAVRLHAWTPQRLPRKVLGIPASYEVVLKARILGLKRPE